LNVARVNRRAPESGLIVLAPRTTPALAALCCVLLGAGCVDRRAQASADESRAPVRGGTLEIVGYSDVDHLATTSAYVTYSVALTRLFARQLVAFEAGSDLEAGTPPAPDLALEVPTRENGGISGDGLTYVFHLRPGVRWDSHPPRDVVAADVVRAFALFCNPVMPVGAAGYYTDTIEGMAGYCAEFARVPATVASIRDFVTTHTIEGVRADDEATVVFRLRAPASDFLNLVAMPFASPVPVEYLDYLPDGPEFRQHTLSTGPYRIARYVQNRELLFERNPVWDEASDPIRPAHVDRVRVRLGIDAQLQQLQIEAGTADLGFETVRAADLAPLLAIDDPTLWLSPPGDAYGLMEFLVFNHIGPNNGGALRRREVRRAIALAVDRSALVQVTGGPRAGRPLRQAVLSSASGWDPATERGAADHGDPATARSLLAEAGYPDGIALRLAFQTFGSYPLMAQVLQASLERAGFGVELVPVTVSDFLARLLADASHARRGEWDLALSGWFPDWFGQNNGRSVIVPLFDGRHLEQNTQNYGHYQNHAVDAAIDRATVAPSAELSEQAWRDAARLLIEDSALVPLIERKTAYAKSRRVRGCIWSVLGLNCDLTSVWLAPTPGAAAR
jgi:peptide/nickel transport system substrate-binding protein